MKANSTTQCGQSLYAAAWQHTGPGILVAMMFVVITSAAMFRERTAVAAIADVNARGGLDFDHGSGNLSPVQHLAVSHSVQLKLPLEHLRDSSGRMTPNGESLFRLLARRMKSLSLTIMLTAHSIDDAEFATTIAVLMMREVPLESTQLRISSDAIPTAGRTPADSVLTVTITRHETIDGDTR